MTIISSPTWERGIFRIGAQAKTCNSCCEAWPLLTCNATSFSSAPEIPTASFSSLLWLQRQWCHVEEAVIVTWLCTLSVGDMLERQAAIGFCDPSGLEQAWLNHPHAFTAHPTVCTCCFAGMLFHSFEELLLKQCILFRSLFLSLSF